MSFLTFATVFCLFVLNFTASGLSCSRQAWLPCSMWDPSSQPGIESVSVALQGTFLTTAPPGKFQPLIFLSIAVSRVSHFVSVCFY